MPNASWCFCLFFTSQKINTKRSPNTAKFFGDFSRQTRHTMGQESTRGVLRGEQGPPRWEQPTKARLGPQAHPGGLCPPRGTPLVLLWPIPCILAQKNSPKSSVAFGLRLVLIFCQVKNKQKNNNWH